MTELVEALGSTTQAGSAEIALRVHGFDGQRLMKLAHAVANDYCRKHGAALGDRFDDLVSALLLAGCKAATKYDPARSGPNYSFSSFLWDKMELAVEPDFFRRKSEGFGDRRYGNDNRIVLADDPDPADHDTDFEHLVDDRRRARWQDAARIADLELRDWILIVLDRAADSAGVPRIHSYGPDRAPRFVDLDTETYWPGQGAAA